MQTWIVNQAMDLRWRRVLTVRRVANLSIPTSMSITRRKFLSTKGQLPQHGYFLFSAHHYTPDIFLSLCGWDPEPTEESFNRNMIPFSDLCNNPGMLESPNLVVRIHDKYYNWKVAAPIISSIVIYQRPLPQVNNLIHHYLMLSIN